MMWSHNVDLYLHDIVHCAPDLITTSVICCTGVPNKVASACMLVLIFVILEYYQ